ncbi:MAG: class I SAM-dependent methyltransferase [Anaerolineae bacterium]
MKIVLADLTRLDFAAATFDVVVCLNHLQHAPDVAALLAEAARVLKPKGLLVANIVPYASYNGAFSTDGRQPWDHLRRPEESTYTSGVILNHWHEDQYRAAFEKFFQIEQWHTEQDERAQTQLTPALRRELAGYDEAELTRKQIIAVARSVASSQ